MAPGGQGGGPGPGMPGVPARPPGWRRRGCRRPPRTGRTARSRRPATRPPHQAGPVRSRHEGLLRPALRTGPSCFPAAEVHSGRNRSRSPARGSGSARLAPHQFGASAARRRNISPGKVLFRGCRGASSLTSPEMSASRASPSSRTRRAVTVSSGAGRFLALIHRRQGRTTDRRRLTSGALTRNSNVPCDPRGQGARQRL